ncbi:hypothetical protein U1Q18_037331 [Sarracenia purpurea var. burkii]
MGSRRKAGRQEDGIQKAASHTTRTSGVMPLFQSLLAHFLPVTLLELLACFKASWRSFCLPSNQPNKGGRPIEYGPELAGLGGNRKGEKAINTS